MQPIMTPGELAAWLHLFSVAYFQPPSCGPGPVTDEMRVTAASLEATRALLAMREVRDHLGDKVLAEVLR